MTEKLRQLILVLGDSLLLYASLAISLSIRRQLPLEYSVWSQHWPAFTVIFFTWIIVFYIAGVYTLSSIKNDLKFYVTASQAIGINIFLAITFFYIFPNLEIAPKTILALTGIIFFLLFIFWRRTAHKAISAIGLKKNTLIIGDSPISIELQKLLSENPQFGYNIVAVLSNKRDFQVPEAKYYRNEHQLSEILLKHKISTIVLGKSTKDSHLLLRSLYEKLNMGLEFLSLAEFYENMTKKIPLPDLDHLWFLENFQEGNKQIYVVIKRTLDIFCSVLGIIISIFILPPIVIILLLTSGRPLLFKQTRLGKNGKLFNAIKLRTMIADAEKNGPQWAIENDPRITTIGKFLRKTRLDEIPQLWNIIKGEMSFVGPRPERPEFITKLAKITPFYRERLLVRPGLTGWAQVNFPYVSTEEDTMKKLQYDLYYIKNRSIILDLAIILKTIKTVISRVGR